MILTLRASSITHTPVPWSSSCPPDLTGCVAQAETEKALITLAETTERGPAIRLTAFNDDKIMLVEEAGKMTQTDFARMLSVSSSQHQHLACTDLKSTSSVASSLPYVLDIPSCFSANCQQRGVYVACRWLETAQSAQHTRARENCDSSCDQVTACACAALSGARMQLPHGAADVCALAE